MGFFKRLSGLFSSGGRPPEAAYTFTVQCQRCGESIPGRVDLRNDLSVNYGEDNQSATYYVRKVLVGEKLCFQRIEVELTFDSDRHLLDRKIQGGSFVDEQAE